MTSLKFRVDENAFICDTACLRGDITIGSGTVVHPMAQIFADAGPIIIGCNNLIEENVLIHNSSLPSHPDLTRVMIIGNDNVFECGTVVESAVIGDNNVFEVMCRLERDAVVGINCVVGAKCVVGQALSQDIVIYGSDERFRIHVERNHPPASELYLLKKILPNFHEKKFLTPKDLVY